MVARCRTVSFRSLYSTGALVLIGGAGFGAQRLYTHLVHLAKQVHLDLVKRRIDVIHAAVVVGL